MPTHTSKNISAGAFVTWGKCSGIFSPKLRFLSFQSPTKEITLIPVLIRSNFFGQSETFFAYFPLLFPTPEIGKKLRFVLFQCRFLSFPVLSKFFSRFSAVVNSPLSPSHFLKKVYVRPLFSHKKAPALLLFFFPFLPAIKRREKGGESREYRGKRREKGTNKNWAKHSQGKLFDSLFISGYLGYNMW